jgi:hypothetical protein
MGGSLLWGKMVEISVEVGVLGGGGVQVWGFTYI